MAMVLARVSCRRNREVDEPALRRCISSRGAGVSYRLRAGLALLVLADLNSEPAIGEDAFSQLSDVLGLPDARENEDALKVQLIYYSSFGEIDKSIPIARRIAQRALSLPSPAAADLLRKAAIGFWRAGQVADFWNAIERAYDAAVEAGLERLLFLISIVAGSAAVDLRDEQRETTWLAVAEGFVTEHPELAQHLDYITFAWELAIRRGNRSDARRLRDAARQQALLGNNRRTRRWMLAMEMRMEYDDRDLLDPESSVRALLWATARTRKSAMPAITRSQRVCIFSWAYKSTNRHPSSSRTISPIPVAAAHPWQTPTRSTRSTQRRCV